VGAAAWHVGGRRRGRAGFERGARHARTHPRHELAHVEAGHGAVLEEKGVGQPAVLGVEHDHGQALGHAPHALKELGVGRELGAEDAVQRVDGELADEELRLVGLGLGAQRPQQKVDVVEQAHAHGLARGGRRVQRRHRVKGLVQARAQRGARHQPLVQRQQHAVKRRRRLDRAAVLGRVGAHDVGHALELFPREGDLKGGGECRGVGGGGSVGARPTA
jgi:hypothetical protein